MQQMQIARDAVLNGLMDVRDIDESVVRGEKRLGNKTYAVAYVDLADNIVARSKNLREFQEQILGDDFFDSVDDLRWNKYLYFVAGPNSMENEVAFAAAKAKIEADKDYARKRVVTEDDLASILGGAGLYEQDLSAQVVNVITDWETRLQANGLDSLLDSKVPRTEAVRTVMQGTARRTDSKIRTKALNHADSHLAKSRLSELTIESFRPSHNGQTYAFGQVTLIVGPNGAGKTSLLEAIEFLYCGHNRRSISISPVKLKAKLYNIDTAEVYPLSSTSESARIKARGLEWYNRDAHSAKAILEGFSRYNFLDTDAAFRISTDLEPSEISTDLSRLLVGSSAAATWDYLTKVYIDLQKALDKTQSELTMQEFVLQTNEEKLSEVLNKPSQSKTLAESFWQTLKSLGWFNIPNNYRLDSSDGELVLNVLGHLQALQASGSGAKTIYSLFERQSVLNTAVTEAGSIEKRLTDALLELRSTSEAIDFNKTNIANIYRWIDYANSEYSTLRNLAGEARFKATNASQQLGFYASCQLPEIPSPYQTVSIEVAMHLANEKLAQAESKVLELQDIAKVHGKTAINRATLANKLKEAALSSLSQSENKDICPVCKTLHPSGEMFRLIDSITEGLSNNIELNSITEAVYIAESTLKVEREKLSAIKFFVEIRTKFGFSKDTTIQDVIRQVVEHRTELAVLDELALSLESQLRIYEDAGFSPEESELVWNKVRSNFNIDVLSVEDARTFIRDLDQKVQIQIEKLDEIQSKIEVEKFDIKNICQRVKTPEWNVQDNTSDTFNTLVSLRDEFSQVINHIQKLNTIININEGTLLSELQNKIASAAVVFKDAYSAFQNEASNSNEQVTLSQTVAVGQEKVQKIEKEYIALKNAVKALGDLISESSLEKASMDSLAAIGGQINEVFSRIHEPNEYKYAGQSDSLLKTINNEEPRTLEQVSTGQRAAFALSIFLALNTTAKSAPPIMLIDDPIAHIDDLNALSFMDYLRDLTVNSGRQIFFATADTKIASLFAKKFSFLNEQFKTISLSRN